MAGNSKVRSIKSDRLLASLTLTENRFESDASHNSPDGNTSTQENANPIIILTLLIHP